MLPSSCYPLPRRAAAGADGEEAAAPGQAGIKQVAIFGICRRWGAGLHTHSGGPRGSWPALGKEVAVVSPASYKGHWSWTRETGFCFEARHLSSVSLPPTADWPGQKLCFLFRDLVVRAGAGAGGARGGSAGGASS